MRRYLLLANAEAGSADDEAITAAAGRLRAAGAEVEVVRTADVATLDGALDRRAGRTPVVCGGDGSVHVTVARLRARGELDVPLGLLPLGTGNDLARGVGIPHDDPLAAADHLLHASPTSMDLLVDDTGEVGVNALHAGIGATAAARSEALKSSLSALAYPVGALLAGVSEQGVPAQVEVDGEILVDDTVLLVAVCNAPSFGGGAHAAPDADPTDGRLDVVAVTATGPLARAAFGLALQRGEHLDRDDVHLARGREVAIVSPGLRYDVDGEVGDQEVEGRRTWRVEPAAWQLLR
jgi:YegS/Rv2252/BmrU family lipid kinase